ncbi:hypothetical protein CsSME_00039176 [Camellia sinensis var. sinensis]
MAMIYDPLVHYQKNLHRIKNVNPDYYRQIGLLADESEGVLGNISSSTAVSIKVFHNKKTCQRAPVASSLITRGRGRTPARGYLLEGAKEGNKYFILCMSFKFIIWFTFYYYYYYFFFLIYFSS